MPPPYALDCLIRDPTVALDLCPNCSVGFYDSVVVTDVFSRNVELCHSRSVGFCDPIVTMEFWSGRNDGWFKQSDGIGFNRSDGTTPVKKNWILSAEAMYFVLTVAIERYLQKRKIMHTKWNYWILPYDYLFVLLPPWMCAIVRYVSGQWVVDECDVCATLPALLW